MSSSTKSTSAPLVPTSSSSQRGIDGDTNPTVARYDLSNMALLFAMGGSYPGCWETFHQDEDQELKLDRRDDEGTRDKEVASEGFAPNEREEGNETGERPLCADRLCSALRESAVEPKDEKSEAGRNDSLIPALDTESSILTLPRSHEIPREEDKPSANRERPGLSLFTGKKKVGPREPRREDAAPSSSYVPTGAPGNEEEARRHSVDAGALHQGPSRLLVNIRDDHNAHRRFSFDPNDLEIPRRRPHRPEGFVPFQKFIQEPGRFLRNEEKLRRQEAGKRALNEAACAVHSSMQRDVSSYSQRTEIADPRAEVRVQRNVSLFSWTSGVTDELEVSKTDVIDAGKRRRYAFVRSRGVQGSQGNAPGWIMAKKDDFDIAAMSRELIEPSCLIHRAQPLRRSRTEGWEPDLHQHIPANVEDRLDEHSTEDIWSFIEGDDRDFTFIEQRQGMIQRLPGEWAQMASNNGIIEQSSYDYVQYEAQMYYDTENRPESRWTSAQRSALYSDTSLSSSSKRPAHHCSTCRTVHTQESVVDQSYPPMRVWETTKIEGTEDEKRLPSETSSMTTEMKSCWCWPFRRATRASEPQPQPSFERGGANNGMWRPKAERRKLFKLAPRHRGTRE